VFNRRRLDGGRPPRLAFDTSLAAPPSHLRAAGGALAALHRRADGRRLLLTWRARVRRRSGGSLRSYPRVFAATTPTACSSHRSLALDQTAAAHRLAQAPGAESRRPLVPESPHGATWRRSVAASQRSACRETATITGSGPTRGTAPVRRCDAAAGRDPCAGRRSPRAPLRASPDVQSRLMGVRRAEPGARASSR
jgi:hypothetical protein